MLYDDLEIEKARKIFSGECKFIAAALDINVIPPLEGNEVAFAGRSNVGKSSLVNALTNRKTLARTSQTPGRTRQLIFFDLFYQSNRLRLVDLPGYGYAKAPKKDIKSWTSLTLKYLKGRPTLRTVCLLIDSRRGIGDLDKTIMKELDTAAVSWVLVLTKIDKLSEEEIIKVKENSNKIISKYTAALSSSFIIVLSKSPIPRLLSINKHTVLSVGLPFKYFKVRDVHDCISFFGAFA